MLSDLASALEEEGVVLEPGVGCLQRSQHARHRHARGSLRMRGMTLFTAKFQKKMSFIFGGVTGGQRPILHLGITEEACSDHKTLSLITYINSIRTVALWIYSNKKHLFMASLSCIYW